MTKDQVKPCFIHSVSFNPDIRRADCSCGWRSHRAKPYRAAVDHIETMHRWNNGFGYYVIHPYNGTERTQL